MEFDIATLAPKTSELCCRYHQGEHDIPGSSVAPWAALEFDKMCHGLSREGSGFD